MKLKLNYRINPKSKKSLVEAEQTLSVLLCKIKSIQMSEIFQLRETLKYVVELQTIDKRSIDKKHDSNSGYIQKRINQRRYIIRDLTRKINKLSNKAIN